VAVGLEGGQDAVEVIPVSVGCDPQIGKHGGRMDELFVIARFTRRVCLSWSEDYMLYKYSHSSSPPSLAPFSAFTD
jgi:hypothetical protein